MYKDNSMFGNGQLFLKLFITIVAITVAGFIGVALYKYEPSKNEPKAAIVVPASQIEREQQALGNHILTVMEIVKSPLSPPERQLTAQMLVGIASNIMDRIDDRENWIYVLGIESRFDQSAISAAGAVGIGQIMPQYAASFGKLCGLEGVQPKDVNNILVNATLSACLFRNLLETVYKRSVVLALAAYNSGPSSASTKNIQNYGSAVPETANYISRFSYLKEMTKVEKKEKENK